jgi:hypothetical protein
MLWFSSYVNGKACDRTQIQEKQLRQRLNCKLLKKDEVTWIVKRRYKTKKEEW